MKQACEYKRCVKKSKNGVEAPRLQKSKSKDLGSKNKRKTVMVTNGTKGAGVVVKEGKGMKEAKGAKEGNRVKVTKVAKVTNGKEESANKGKVGDVLRSGKVSPLAKKDNWWIIFWRCFCWSMAERSWVKKAGGLLGRTLTISSRRSKPPRQGRVGRCCNQPRKEG